MEIAMLSPDFQNRHLWQAVYRISLEGEPWELSLLDHKTSEAVTTAGLSCTGLLSKK